MTRVIPFAEGEANLEWIELAEALEAGHRLPRAEISDSLLHRGKDTLLVRQAWIDGLGIAVKSATVFPDNPAAGAPMIHGSVTLFDDTSGTDEAFIDFHLVTKWKTAADSLLAARKLARPDSRNILILGAGTVGHSLYDAYRSLFPNARFLIWNRTQATAEKMAMTCGNMQLAPNLEAAVKEADIITSATMSTTPILQGAWLQPGQHIDLVGAYLPTMREADDETLQRSRIFVDSFETTVDQVGELKTPLETGVIVKSDLIADFYNLDRFERQSDDDITLFKNGGGAHLDLMTARYILDKWEASA
ncbi:ornithine cyclodeaminase [Shimia thalassica]|uniref:ornithine cyclodeaminase family protein n=1 Tax=Shimia thalassica TaxID=1715693 RepID=UPI002732F3CA|nr:ornithine cyclodeaminase [Shimia thalassica]MDP2578969.1 ornithine cyclodeaminase [Shimia thalassica]